MHNLKPKGQATRPTEQVGEAGTRRLNRPNFGIGIIIVAGLLLLWVFSPKDSPTPATTVRNDESPSTDTVRQTNSSVPPLQKSFTSMIGSFIPKYNSAGSEVLAANDQFRQVEQEHRKTNVRVERKNAIASYFSGSRNLQFQGWIGEVADTFPYQDLDGTESAYFSVKLRGSDIVLETAGGSKVLDAMILEKAVKGNEQDLFSPSPNTMISRKDVLYQSLMNIKKGDVVTVSGTFLLKNNGGDYLYEASATEKGSMTEPEFFVKFSQISKGVQLFEEGGAAQPVTPVVSQEASPPAVVSDVAPMNAPPVLPHDATCEVVDAGSSIGFSRSPSVRCLIEKHGTNASTGEEDWEITILNSSFAQVVLTPRIELQDGAGAVVGTASWEPFTVTGYGRYVFTRRLEYDSKLTFARVVANLEASQK